MTSISFYTVAGAVVSNRQPQSIDVPNIAGSPCTASAELVALYAAASQRYTVPAALLLAQGAQESAFNPSAVSGDGGYGIAQWTYEPTARQYLGVPASNDWHPAALDPARAIPAQAAFMADLRRQMGSWHGACAAYNGGPNGENVPAAHAYADGLLARAALVEPRLLALPYAAPPLPAFKPYYARLKAACALKQAPNHTSPAVVQAPAQAGVEAQTPPQIVGGEQWVKVLYGPHGAAYTGYALAANLAAASPPAPPSSRTYTVVPGDTLSAIGTRFDVDWQAIYQANRQTIGPDPNTLAAGETLTIPAA